jgi:hypothetical protein
VRFKKKKRFVGGCYFCVIGHGFTDLCCCYWKGVGSGSYAGLFLAAFSGVMRAGPLKSGVHLFLLTNITCTEFFQTYRFTPKGPQQHPQNGSVGQRKAIKFRQIDRFS